MRTADDALIRVKLMMFYELTNIEQMVSVILNPLVEY